MTFADDEESGRDEEQERRGRDSGRPAEDTAAEPDASATEGTESETVAEPGDVAEPPRAEAAAEPEAEEPAAEPEEEAPAEPRKPRRRTPSCRGRGASSGRARSEQARACRGRTRASRTSRRTSSPAPTSSRSRSTRSASSPPRSARAPEAEEEERAAREARSTAEDDDEEIAPRTVTVPADAQIQATGKRKSAVARVIVRSGSGEFQVNDRSLEEYFPSSLHQSLARQALVSSGYDGSVDVKVRVHGGGISGQAGAVRHGVARALTSLEPELRGDLKRRGMLTRDDRRKERKKAGLKKARKRPQFSKR